jgi:glyoxylase-like metal-dependent hydrolase (beta-lactamase superfamily II)
LWYNFVGEKVLNWRCEVCGIYRIKIPFENLYTSVFFIETEDGNMLVDCGTTAKDVDQQIVPALCQMGVNLESIRYLVLTHTHGDHAGGLERVLQLNSKLKIIKKVPINFPNGLTVYALKGHTTDCVGVFDERTGTLITGDALQGAGVEKYPCFLESKVEYLKTIEQIKKDKRVKNILFSHAYEPWRKDGMFGREEVERCLQDCINISCKIVKR